MRSRDEIEETSRGVISGATEYNPSRTPVLFLQQIRGGQKKYKATKQGPETGRAALVSIE